MTDPQDAPTTPPGLAEARIFAFYSHTGGTGRSLTLATVAWILASAGYRVLAVDWSLAAPSLHRFLAPFLADPELRSTPGVTEMVTELMVDGLSSPGAEPDPDWVARHTLVRNHAVSVEHDFPDGGVLDLVPAGRQSPGYNSRVAAIDWDHFYLRHRGGAFLALLRQSMLEHYDYVLIDTMNGGAPPAALVTGLLADTVVVCARAGSGSIEGAVAAAQSIRALGGGRDRRVLAALMQVDRSDRDRLEATRRFAEQRWNELVGGEPLTRIATEVPYSTELAFEEVIAPFAETSSSAADVLRACGHLVASLTGETSIRSLGLEPGAWAQFGSLYRRTLPTEVPAELTGETSRVVISYVAYDRPWADWLQAQLDQVGVPTELVGNADPEQGPGELGPGARVLALFSKPYYRSPHARSVWESVLAQEVETGRRILVPVRLDYASPTGIFDRRPHLDLAAKDALTARNTVLTALGRDLADDDASVDALRIHYPLDRVDSITNLDRRNEHFFGRSDVLEELRDAFERAITTDPTAPAVVVLHAVDGIGKGEVAREYAYRFAGEYDIVWRLPGESGADRRGALAALADRLGLAPPGHDDRNNVRETVENVGERRMLLIFENVDDPREILESLPDRAASTQVIINAQRPATDPDTMNIKIGVFRRAESVTYLRSQQDDLPDESAREIAELVDDLPMALDQASGCLRNGMTAAQYAAALNAWLPPGTDAEDYRRPLVASWLVTIDRLRSIDELAVSLLELCACFGPAAIPNEVLRGTTVMDYLRLPIHESGRLEAALDLLHEFSLARHQPGSRTVELHRLLRATVQQQLSYTEFRVREEVVAEALANVARGDTEDTENWTTYERLFPHVRACTLQSDSESVRQLLGDSVRAAWRYGSWTVSRQLAEAAIEAWGKRFPANDTFVLLMRYHRVNVLWSEGHFSMVQNEATDIRNRFMEILDPDAEYTLNTAMILAASERALGHFQRAKTLDRDTLDRLRARTPEHNRRRLAATNNLADSERLMGQYRAALRLDEQTLQLRRRRFALDHPWTLQSHASVGFDHRALGNLQSSADNLTLALKGLERVLGIRHEDTIRTRKSLAATRRKLDDISDAARLIEQAAADADAVFPPNHPDLLSIRLERAAVLAAQRRNDEARRTARDVVERFRLRFDDDRHPFLLAAEANLVAYQRQGRRLTRLELRTARRVQADLVEVLNERHPWAIAARVNLGNCLFDIEDFYEARDLDESTFAMARAVLGADHPDTLVAGLNFALSSDHNHRGSSTSTLSGEITEIAEQRFGPQHRIARAIRERRRLDCDLELPPI